MRAGPVLTVGGGPTLAVSWLIPRLASFYRSHPEVEVRMATGGATRPVRDDWTCTIRRDTDAWPGNIAENLFTSTVVPVCTQEIASTLRSPEDLRGVTLIKSEEHKSEPQSLMRISYAVFCLKKNNITLKQYTPSVPHKHHMNL